MKEGFEKRCVDFDTQLKKSESLSKSWKNREDFIGDIVGECPPLYNVWRSFRFTKKGKAIGNEASWNSFRNFYNDMRESYFTKATLQRIDKSKPFSKDNVAWMSRHDAAVINNPTIMITYQGKTLSIVEWAQEIGCPPSAIRNRYHKHKADYSTEEILYGKRKLTNNRIPKDVSELQTLKEVKAKASKMISSYKIKDKRNNYPISDIDRDWMIDHILLNECIYCGDTNRLGCDRLDNASGHTKSNVVPCCYECNCARNNNFSHEEMKEIGKAIKQIKINRGAYRSNIDMVNKIRIERGYEPLN